MPASEQTGFKYAVLLLGILTLYVPAQAQTNKASVKSSSKKHDVVASVNGRTITQRDVFKIFANRHRQETYDIIQELIVIKLVQAETVEERLTIKRSSIRREVKKSLAQSKKTAKEKMAMGWEEYLQARGMTEKQYKRQEFSRWKYNLALYRLVRLSQFRETRIKARHILLKTLEQAKKTRKKLLQGADFEILAKQKSLSKAQQGGRLPTVFRGDLPSLEKTLFALKSHEISEIIETQWGFHIIQVLKILPGQPNATWAQLKNRVIASLKKNPVTAKDIQRWLNRMQAKHEIKIMLK